MSVTRNEFPGIKSVKSLISGRKKLLKFR